MKNNFLTSLARKEPVLKYNFKDENNLLLSNGEVRKLSEDDSLIIKYKDKEEFIKFKDLYKHY